MLDWIYILPEINHSQIMSNLYISADLKGNCLLQPDFAVVDIPLNLFEIKSLFLKKKKTNMSHIMLPLAQNPQMSYNDLWNPAQSPPFPIHQDVIFYHSPWSLYSSSLLFLEKSRQWEGSLGKNWYMYQCGWIHLLSTWNYHNILIQLYPNTK